jgi:DNA-binding response OmpR family regulator
MKSLLLVDDELEMSVEIQRKLERAKFHVELAHDVESAQDLVDQTHFDLIMLDLNLKEESTGSPNPAHGTGLLRQFRAAGINVPILVYSLMASEFNVTASLDAGADEYIVKRGESFRVLLARIQAHFRRDERPLGAKSPTTRWVATDQIKLDRQEGQLAVGNTFIELSVQQTKIMAALTASPSKIFSSEELLTIAWGKDVRRETSALDTILYRLRQKFEKATVQDLIENVRGQGYRLAVTSDAPEQ